MSAALLISALISTLPASPTTADSRYDGSIGITVVPHTASELTQLRQAAQVVVDDRVGIGAPMQLVVSPDMLATMPDHTVWADDVGALIRDERDRIDDWHSQPMRGGWYDEFHPLVDVEARVDALASQYPDLVSVETVGQSIENRTIRVMRITSGKGSGKAGVFVFGGQHAREWISIPVAMYVADHFVRSYGADAEITRLLDGLEIHVVAVMNPDGYQYTWDDDRMWRKNRGADGKGVDLNRNWGNGWGGPGSSGNPNDEDYRGPSAFSEPESKALSDYVNANTNLKAQIDFHCYAWYVAYPPGCENKDVPQQTDHTDMAVQLANTISSVYGEDYTEIRGYDWYPACGASDDWGAHNGLLSFTIEVRGDNFMLAPDEILPTAEENFAGVLDLANWVLDRNPPSDPGDDEGSSGDTGGADDDDDDDDDDENDDDKTGCGCASASSSSPSTLSVVTLFGLLGAGRRRRRANERRAAGWVQARDR